MSKVDQLRALREAAAALAPERFTGSWRGGGKSTATRAPVPEEAKPLVHDFAATDEASSTVPASTTYQYRDPDKRRAYMREYAKKRRALKAAEREAAKEQGR